MIYPNEAWPADTAVQSLDGSTDAGTGLPYIAKGTGPGSVPPYEVQYNRREQRLNSILAGWRQGMVVSEGGLKIGVYPIEYTLGGSRRGFDGASGVLLPDNALKAIYLDNQDQLRVGETFPTDISSFLPLAIVQTAGGRVTITDTRGWTAFHVPSGGGAVTDRRMLNVYRSAVAGEQPENGIFEFEAPENLVLEGVQVFCADSVPTATVDVRNGAASMLSAPAVAQGGVLVKASVAAGNLAAGNHLRVYANTDPTGFISDLTITLLLRNA